MRSIPQIKKLRDPEAFGAHLSQLGVSLPIAEPGAIALTLGGGVDIDAGDDRRFGLAPNRFAILPMEGWDATTDGHPTDLVRRRWSRFGASGAGLVWAEATAVLPEGRANANQLMLNSSTVNEFADLRKLLSDDQVVGLQLTHSGRWSRPDGTQRPRVAYRHPQLDERVGATDDAVLSDGELDELVTAYVSTARLADEAGFDFVDVKACHGYLLHELLSGHDREGRFGGSLENRSRVMSTALAEIRREVPDLGLAVRLSAFDIAPFEAGSDGVGVSSTEGPYPYAFGGDGSGTGIDLSETHELLDMLTEVGVQLVSVTAGSPYYNPHVQRPAYFPPSDGYQPPEDPLIGVARQVKATAEITKRHPQLTVVASALSYLQEWLPAVGAGIVSSGGATMVGLGRMALSYPDLPVDVLAGAELDRRLICRTFSDCTTAPRNGLISGCYPIDPFYKEREERVTLAGIKKDARARLRSA